jgi:hypothetical protein
MEGHYVFFNVGHTVLFPSLKCLTGGPIKMNIVAEFLANLLLSILLLQTRKTDNNALDINAILYP